MIPELSIEDQVRAGQERRKDKYGDTGCYRERIMVGWGRQASDLMGHVSKE